jgi:tRNA 2-thiouridine synthesizing protein A
MHRMAEGVKELDLRGLKCPLPVLRTRKALARLDPGASLVVFATDPLSRIDIPHLIHETGDVLEQSREDGGVFIFHLLRR